MNNKINSAWVVNAFSIKKNSFVANPSSLTHAQNKKAQSGLVGFALLTVFFLLMITAFVTIEPFKEALDNSRGNSDLNCPGTPTFNQSAYNTQTDFEQLVRRPTCFTTGLYMVFFICIFLIAAVSWVYRNWRRV